MTKSKKNSSVTVSGILKMVKDNNVEFVDFRFCDYNGKWLHISHCADMVGDEALTTGVAFDGSSVEAWKDINESDMVLKPQLDSAFIDPFNSSTTLVLICDVIEPQTDEGYDRDPRNTAKKAEKYLKDSGIGDVAYFGPEPEFFVFDDVKFGTNNCGNFYEVNGSELPKNSSISIEGGNMGHRSQPKGSYFDLSPLDSGQDLRSEIVDSMKQVKLVPSLHHHEVANAQHEIGFEYSTLTHTADNIQKFKYVVQNVADAYGKTATFMPKPIYQDNGSGMHVHQSIWKQGKNLFSGTDHANLSELALYYIGGIIKHAKAINAFSNATTNSYKRLVPGFEAPIILAYSAKNRSASIRIPHVANEKARRIETRFPDPAGNPYLTCSALLMAGLDGIKNKIHPGEPRNQNLYDLSREEVKSIPQVARSLREALDALDKDRGFLLEGGVFTNDQIDAYIELKTKEVEAYEQTPHPIEFSMYYSR
ncbi:MAG: type I glutamate--ammonia ligase [Rickettsiales bacterium]|nr:type I glutamate--ammonia ligase [Rickettsiales bacterium]